MGPHPRNVLLVCFLAGVLGVAPVLAQETDTTEVLSFDAVEDEPPPPTAAASWTDRIHLNGRFDLNLEVQNPRQDGDLRQAQFRNYHRFLFLKVKPDDRLAFDAEVLDLSYYELRYLFWREYTVHLGKIWVPFGATPFHHFYGGAQGDPFEGLLLPNVWAEYGASVSGPLFHQGSVSVDADAYVIRGFQGTEGEVLRFTGGGADDLFAVGARTRVGFGSRFTVWGSVLYNQFGVGNQGEVLLWGGDLLADYGLVDLPVLNDLRLRAAFARADIRDRTLVDPRNSKDYWYYRYGDYAELTYRGFRYVFPRLRYGTIIDFDDRITNRDSHNWDLALLTRLGPNVLLLAEYQFNLEEVNERNNDLFRFQIAFEF